MDLLQEDDSDCQEGGEWAGQSGPAPAAPPHPPTGCEKDKFVTDNLSLMCEYECLLCGASLKVRA